MQLRIAFIAMIAAALFACAAGFNSPRNQPVAELPFDSVLGGMAFFPATVNSAGPFQFLLDTGGAGSLVDRELAHKLAVKLERGVASVSGSANLEVGVIPRAVIEVGKARYQGRLTASPLAPLEPAIGRPFEGIIGGDLLQRYVLEMDYDKGVMRFYEPAAFQYAGRGQSLPLSFAQGVPFINLEVSLPGGKSVKGDFLIDTAGGRMAIHIHKEIAEREGLFDGSPMLEEKGLGLGGATSRKVARGAMLSIGTFRLPRPFVAFTEDTAGLRTNPNSVGLVGMEVLRRFKLTFDYSRKLLHLEPNRSLRAQFVYDASGLLLRATRPSFSPPYVFRVRDNSPAKEAGLEPDDVLLQIDGRSISALKLDAVRELLKQPGKTHKLSFSRKGKTMEATLKTRDMLE